MRHSTKTLVVAFVAAVMMAMPCAAQYVEPPFTWEGDGTVSLISESGINEIEFEFELSIDEQGMFKGQASNEEGSSAIKHVFYADEEHYDFGIFSRRVVIVILINEYGSSPMLSVLNGRLLVDKFFYGEVMLAAYEAGSDTAKGLGVGTPEAAFMEGGELPYGLKSALKRCMPVGAVKIEGGYKTQSTGTAAGGLSGPAGDQDDQTIALFNGRDFEGWHMYLKDADADPKSVWEVRDGAIWCTGEPVGCLRTTKEYSDYRLVLEWRWPEKPSNSGVLLRMGGEEKIWPMCMEAQLMHKRAGDIVGMGYDFNEDKSKEDGFISYAPRLNDSNEKEPGGWNTYEILCKGDTIELRVNGLLQNKATGVNVRKGYIGLQSEGSPIMFRNIKLTPLR
ncbi:MAG: 3-keto-disaccharide hydrolase [Planctomycetota bacterium]|jgi:hypothetical protein